MISSTLSQKKCIACQTGVKLSVNEAAEYKQQISPQWQIKDGKLTRAFKFKNFAEAKSFVDKISELAENEGHHPDLHFGWGYAAVTLYTHKIHGLTEADFVLAAKIDNL